MLCYGAFADIIASTSSELHPAMLAMHRPSTLEIPACIHRPLALHPHRSTLIALDVRLHPPHDPSSHRTPPRLVPRDTTVLGALVTVGPGAEGRRQLVVNTLLADRGQCTVLVALDAQAHARVLAAGQHPGTLVRCTGQLLGEGSVLRLSSPSSLELFVPRLLSGPSA